jgi:hypothetical protein
MSDIPSIEIGCNQRGGSRITLMRFRIPLFTLMRVRIRLLTVMRIRIRILLLIKAMRICDEWLKVHRLRIFMTPILELALFLC